MKKYFCTLALVLLFTSIYTYSQKTDTSNSTRNSLQKHSWAVQFAVGNNFKLQSFEGLMVSLKYHLTGHSGFRFGVGFTGNQDNGTINNDYITNSPIYGNNESVFAVLNFLYYFKPGALINLYAGAGPRFSYSHSYRVHWYISPNDDQMYKNNNFSWRAGFQGVFGAEWFPVRFLSIFAEYSAYGVFGKDSDMYRIIDENGVPHSEDFNSHVWEFNGTSALMGISVYF